MPGFEDATLDMLEAICRSCEIFEELVAPTNWPQILSQLTLITVKLSPLQHYMVSISRWLRPVGVLGGAQTYGGAGFPGVADLAVQEMLQSSNMGLSLLPLLTRGVNMPLTYMVQKSKKMPTYPT